MKKRKYILFRIIAIALVMSFFMAEPAAVYAKTSEELESEQKKLEEEEKKLEKQKKDLEKQKTDSQNKLNNANSQIGTISEAQGETQEAIELAGYKPLTNDSPRDSIIMTGLIFHKPISAINDDLYYIDPSLNLYLL